MSYTDQISKQASRSEFTSPFPVGGWEGGMGVEYEEIEAVGEFNEVELEVISEILSSYHNGIIRELGENDQTGRYFNACEAIKDAIIARKPLPTDAELAEILA